MPNKQLCFQYKQLRDLFNSRVKNKPFSANTERPNTRNYIGLSI